MVSFVYKPHLIITRVFFVLLLLVFNIAAFCQVNLQSGWNLVGNGSNSPILPSSIGTNAQVTSVWKWDAKNSKWSFYSPQKQDGGQAYSASQSYEFLISINPNDGFWINAAQPYSLSLNTGGISASTFNALASLGSASTQSSSTSVSSVLSEAVIVHTGVLTAIVSGVSGPVPFLQSALSYLKTGGSHYSICVNTPWIDATHSSSAGNNCSSSGISLQGTWFVPSGSTNSIKGTDASNSTFLNTITFTDINATQGILYQSEPNTYGNVQGFAGSSAYLMLSNTFSIQNLAGVTSLVAGQSDCTNGFASFVFSNDGTSASRTCQTTKVDGSTNTAVTINYANSSIPGVLTATSNGQTNYVGITSGSNSASGQMVLIKPGTTQCGTGSGYSLNYCGSITVLTYSN